jgi:radical SAM protein with 4Fe4S-binding SPASM domain
MVDVEEYERILNWFYDQASTGDIELKATCAPHYFRVVRQRRAAERKQEGYVATPTVVEANQPAISATEMTMPGSTGIAFTTNHEKFAKSGLRHDGMPHPHGHPGGDPNAMNAMTKGCLAGTGVCFISFDGEVFPCGYLPAIAGDLKKQPFSEIWNDSQVFADLRDIGKLEGKCGCCEFRNVCMGCRARAYAKDGNYMAAEPFCSYQPKALAEKE